MPSPTFDEQLKAGVLRRLQDFEHRQSSTPGLRDAAVALILAQCPVSGQPSVLPTRRPKTLNRHAGQYALPGGRVDAGESPVEAALREVREEIGLALSPAEVLGRLDDFETRSGFRISPFVMWCDQQEDLHPDPAEVDAVFHIPLTELEAPGVPKLSTARTGDTPVLSAFLPTLGHEIYAPTAALLVQFRDVALRGVHTRVAHFEQPAFTWK